MFFRPTSSKYGNRKTTLGDKTFDSQKEARRYQELLLLKNAKDRSERVVEIECQPEFVLVPRWEEVVDGKKKVHRASKYLADFRVTYADGRVEIEDVKGFLTPVYRLKLSMLLYQHRLDDPPFVFREV